MQKLAWICSRGGRARTRAQWEAVVGKTHSDYFPGPDVPMNLMTWYDATLFIKKLNMQEGVEYRLPTEAEWEFAARAGSATAYPTGDTEQDLAKTMYRDMGMWYWLEQADQPPIAPPG